MATGPMAPTLDHVSAPNGIAWWTDEALARELGVRIAFSERGGGHSSGPYASLNLAAHVGDDPGLVDRNRGSFLGALALDHCRERLTMAEQVHGTSVAEVTGEMAGAGGFALNRRTPVAATDALFTAVPDTPLMLCFADCVPVIMVGPGPVVAVVHAGWRGALGDIAAKAAVRLAEAAACDTSDLRVYVGPHIAGCHYETSEEILSQFVARFGIVARAESGFLDLGPVIARSLDDVGVASCQIASLGMCTAEETDRFYSYRAERGLTGRHGALACIL